MLPFADNFKDNIDPKFITSEMYALGKEFIKRFPINYEWVDNVKDYYDLSPLTVSVRFSDYNKPEDILKPEGTPNHRVFVLTCETDYVEVFDTYFQIVKRYDPDYVYSPMAHYLTFTNMDNNFIANNDKKWVRNQNTGQFGRVLQGKLFVFNSTDRGALALLDDKVRTDGITITNDQWQALPKADF